MPRGRRAQMQAEQCMEPAGGRRVTPIWIVAGPFCELADRHGGGGGREGVRCVGGSCGGLKCRWCADVFVQQLSSGRPGSIWGHAHRRAPEKVLG